jgi:hypothetical protein
VAGFREIINALLGVSAYTPPLPNSGPSLDDKQVENIRESMGGQLAPPPITQPRWYRADLESALYMADSGDISKAAQLWRSIQTDGVAAGVMGTLTGGITRLKKKYRGKDEIVEELQRGYGSVRSVFDEMNPPAEVARMAADGVALGISVLERVPVPGRDFPVLVRLDPAYLYYLWSENRWYYRSVAGNLPITPGDGRWVLHIPGGRVAPWQQGKWPALGKAFIRKTHADLHKDNWEAKLANAARVAVSPQGAGEAQKQAWWRAVMAWGVNTVFGVTPGYDVKLIESNGRGHESFESSMDRSDRETIIAIAGQIVTTEGGTGFVNGDLYKSIRADVIQEVAESIAYTINTQVLPHWIASRYGLAALVEGGAIYEYDVDPPKELAQVAASMTATGAAIRVLDQSLAPHNLQSDAKEILQRAGVPTVDGAAPLPATTDAGGGADADKLASSAESTAVSAQTKAPKVEADEDEEAA